MAPTNAQTAIVGKQQTPETPNTSMADALSGDFQVPLSQTIAKSANSAAENNPNPNQPGAWARNLLAGVQDALSGFGAEGKVPEGAGALYGLGAGMRAERAHREQQAQQAIENKNKQQEMSREEAISRATIAHENAATVYQQQLSSSLNYKNRQENVATGKIQATSYIQDGAPVIAEGINSDEAQQMIQQKKLDPTQQHAFPTGEVPVLGTDGQPQFDASGNPLMRPTYTVLGDVPQVVMDDSTPEKKASRELINKYTNYNLPAGSRLSGTLKGTLDQMAASAQTAQLAIQEANEEAGIKAAQTQISAEALKFQPDWGNALGKAHGNFEQALTDPTLTKKWPNARALAANLQGGADNLEKVIDKQKDQAQKQQELDQKKNSTDYEGDPDAVTPQQFLASLSPDEQGVVKLIGEGRAPLNSPTYLLARKPEVLAAVERAYPGFDASKVSSYQKTYANYTSGDVSKQLTSGATALQHLQELKQLNSTMARIPGTAAHQAYQNKVDTVAAELARFYGNTTEQGIKSYRDTLNSLLNRNAAIETQAKSMGDRLDNLKQEWDNAAPSKAYQAPMPGISSEAKKARAALDPDYAKRTISVQIPGAQPGYIPEYMLNDFLAAHPNATVNR